MSIAGLFSTNSEKRTRKLCGTRGFSIEAIAGPTGTIKARGDDENETAYFAHLNFATTIAVRIGTTRNAHYIPYSQCGDGVLCAGRSKSRW